MESMIRDIKLAPSGHDKIEWVKNFMPVMAAVDAEFSKTKPFAGKKMVITLHLEAKTAYMAEVFKNAGAEVAITGSNPLSTQDDIAAALVEDGINVFAWHACTDTEYFNFIDKALDIQPDIIIDDGGDLERCREDDDGVAAVLLSFSSTSSSASASCGKCTCSSIMSSVVGESVGRSLANSAVCRCDSSSMTIEESSKTAALLSARP